MNNIIEYNKNHCWQYDIRLKKLEEDKHLLGLTDKDIKQLKPTDFTFQYIPKTDKDNVKKVKKFIERYEWLGKLHIWSTHRFACYYNNIMGGAVIMATPNAFSNLLGEQYKDKEKLISRGACASWTPKNLNSWLIMKSIDWMVKNTDYKIFTAYSDPEARELGTIYQACNFFYLGQTSGSKTVYFDPKRPHLGWIGSRSFTYRSCFVNYARELGIDFDHKNWLNSNRKINWNAVPDHIEKRLKDYAKQYRESCESKKAPPKHKYVYIKGKDRKETKDLIQHFKKLNPDKINLSYPKNRGE